MAKIKQKVSLTDTETNQIRKQWDTQAGRWYFSITDIKEPFKNFSEPVGYGY